MTEEIEDQPQPLMDHLVELRSRLVRALGAFFVAFLVCFYFAKDLFNLLVIPFKWAIQLAHLDLSKAEFIYTAPQEFFFTQLKVAMFGALIVSFPIIASQIYKFVAPGLYKNERSAFLPFLIASPVLFLLGGALVYFFFTPMVMWFFLRMEVTGTDTQVAIQLMPKVSEYLSLIMTLVFSFGLVFQLPVVTSLLVRADILSAESLASKRKYAIVAAFIVAAVLTPPDPMSQIGLALPTILLYEISIYSARLIERKKAAKKETESEESQDSQEGTGSEVAEGSADSGSESNEA
jgi:sec-independent protein translocase protein TatC